MNELVAIDRRLSRRVDALTFEPPTAFVYNPLAYARAPHEAFLERYGAGTREVVLIGMNPGPFGMAQTGVPFGDPTFVREWMGIDGLKVKKPPREHPKRPIVGLESPRSEVSGTRLWGWAKDRFGTADAFFARFFAINYCPLVFMEESGRNRIPEKLPKPEREALFEACDEALSSSIAALKPELVVGVGKFAEDRARAVLGEGARVGRILHPSPASPAANRGWAAAVEAELRALGVKLP
ncbi:MAG: single-stranded DNA-binding protein [Sandaracinaceae bacterium]|nr:single-stranded DNA-binding protein [Sandaracinaceae bacterium]